MSLRQEGNGPKLISLEQVKAFCRTWPINASIPKPLTRMNPVCGTAQSTLSLSSAGVHALQSSISGQIQLSVFYEN